MYYRRFDKETLDFALACETITHEQYQLILEVFETDTIVLKGQEGVETLRSFIPDIEQVDYEPDHDLYFIHIRNWSHLKPMCLKFAPKNPCMMKYVQETDDELVLFEYHLHTFSIFSPSTVPQTDSLNTTEHGLD